MQRRPFVLGNWKLNKSVAEARAFLSAFRLHAPRTQVEVLVAPPATALASLASEGAAEAFALCGQDAHDVDAGAFTGALSAPLLKDAGASWLLVGHSERRKHFGESIEMTARKVAAGGRAGLGIVLCVGEAAAKKAVGEGGPTASDAARAEVERQLAGALASPSPPEQLVVAYEPGWAIGTAQSAEPTAVAAMHRHIRGWLRQSWGAGQAEMARVVYGGGVQPAAVAALLREPEVDGLLVGKASLSAGSFASIVAAMHQARLFSA